MKKKTDFFLGQIIASQSFDVSDVGFSIGGESKTFLR